MKKRRPIIITLIIALIAAVPLLTDTDFVSSIFNNIKNTTASINNSEKTVNSKIAINPELLAIPFSSTPEKIVHHTGYALLYSEEYEQAAWVAYVLSAKEVQGKVPRSNNFRADPDIQSGSAILADYKGSGYDRGHLAPAGDMKWSKASMRDSFYLSNMSPQVPGFNRDIWRRLEEWVRVQAIKDKGLLVITGPVLTDGPYKEIGPDGVDVPKRYFKVLLDYTEPGIKSIGFIIANKASKRPVTDFAVSVDKVEAITGLDFFYLLDDTYENALESKFNTNLWK